MMIMAMITVAAAGCSCNSYRKLAVAAGGLGSVADQRGGHRQGAWTPDAVL